MIFLEKVDNGIILFCIVENNTVIFKIVKENDEKTIIKNE